jgi:copper homeostasis protein
VRLVVEAAVDSLDAALAAEAAGADRLELCAHLDHGGLTPDGELIRAVLEQVRIPVVAMLRPRPGDFVYSAAELGAMAAQAAGYRASGVQGIVTGTLDRAGAIDVAAMRTLIAHAAGLPVTFHRAFDAVSDQRAALEVLIELGVQRILTSGGAPSATEGTDALARLARQAGRRIEIMPGGGVTGANVRTIIAATCATSVHARCGPDGARIREIRAALPVST